MEDKQKKSSEHSNRRPQQRWFNFSFTTRIAMGFALVAMVTMLISIVVLSVVWQQQFQAYTRENVDRIATSTAAQIGERYAIDEAWTEEVLRPASAAARFSPDVGIQVVDAQHNVLFDTTRIEGVPDISLIPMDADSITTAPIHANYETVGTVRVWVYGSKALVTEADKEFRDKSYEAMVIAAIFAVVIAALLGIPFARGLVRPINRVSRAAKEFGEGNLGARTNMEGEDEIARLGQTFDRMAESVEKDRELEHRLTSDVAHELRTPLMAIQSTVEAMIDGVFQPDAERLDTVNSEVQRLSRLVDAILKLTRLENRSTPLNREVVNVGELISGLAATHEAFVRDSGLNFTYSADPAAVIYADPDLIRQAAANLISNAVRYTPEGCIDVSVTVEGENVRIAVSDTGIGLSEEDAKMVFSRFWRADSGRNRESGGLGVGLALVKEIVEQHNGSVEVKGELNKGSTFTLVLPLYNEEAPLSGRRKNRSSQVLAETTLDAAWDEDWEST